MSAYVATRIVSLTSTSLISTRFCSIAEGSCNPRPWPPSHSVGSPAAAAICGAAGCVLHLRFFMRISIRSSLLVLALAASLTGCTVSAATRTPIPAPTTDATLAPKSGKQTAVFAGGCFWGTQAVFERVKGVLKTTTGSSGGSASTATYDQVTTETTGHAESVQVVFDPAKITYGQLLRIF